MMGIERGKNSMVLEIMNENMKESLRKKRIHWVMLSIGTFLLGIITGLGIVSIIIQMQVN
jgi:cytoskeletal protein RodZ